MDVKKVTRNPLMYVLLIGALLLIGFMLISSLTGAKQITTQQGFELLKGDTVCSRATPSRRCRPRTAISAWI